MESLESRLMCSFTELCASSQLQHVGTQAVILEAVNGFAVNRLPTGVFVDRQNDQPKSLWVTHYEFPCDARAPYVRVPRRRIVYPPRSKQKCAEEESVC